MKATSIAFIAAFIPVAIAAQTNNPIFHGGIADGHSTVQTFTTSSVATIMHGGNGDGNIFAARISSSADVLLTRGGSGDGHTFSFYLQPVASAGVAHGGIGDGSTINNYLQLLTSIYNGGIADGNVFNRTVAPVVDRVFMGGIGDGWAANYLPVTPLPVSLLSFSGRKENDVHLLYWLSASEGSTVSYVVQRSPDATSFNDLGMQSANGGTGKHSYEFTDKHPMEGNNYYRLKMKDNLGKATFSNVVLLQRVHDSYTLLVYPNPAASVLNLRYENARNNSESTVVVYDMQGRTMINQRLTGSSVYGLDISKLLPGTYLLKILGADDQPTVSFIKN